MTVNVPSNSAMNASFATGLEPALCDAMWAAGWHLVLDPGQPPAWVNLDYVGLAPERRVV